MYIKQDILNQSEIKNISKIKQLFVFSKDLGDKYTKKIKNTVTQKIKNLGCKLLELTKVSEVNETKKH